MKNILSHHNVLSNISLGDEIGLIRSYQSIHIRLQPINNNFTEQLVNRITHRYRPELINSLGASSFWNKAYICIIDLLYSSFLHPQTLDKSINTMIGNISSALIESCWKIVRPMVLPSRHIKKRLLNLRIGNVRLKGSSMLIFHDQEGVMRITPIISSKILGIKIYKAGVKHISYFPTILNPITFLVLKDIDHLVFVMLNNLSMIEFGISITINHPLHLGPLKPHELLMIQNFTKVNFDTQIP